MHESGIAERIVAVALERARESGAARITDLHLEVGEEAGASPEAVAFHVEEASRGTMVEGARIHFVETSDPRALRLVWIDVEDPDDRFA
jgi:hydrogenase nickel incorporation protein HypA/HybF